MVQNESTLDYTPSRRDQNGSCVTQGQGGKLLSTIWDVGPAGSVAVSLDVCKICRSDGEIVNAVVTEKHWVVLSDADLQLLRGRT